MSFNSDKSSTEQGVETPPTPTSLEGEPKSQDTPATTVLNKQRDPAFEIVLDRNNSQNPQSWSTIYRAWVIGVVAFSAWVVVLYSTSYMSSLPELESEFRISHLGATTGLTSYLMGLAIGSLLSAPLSELYGRRIVYIGCFSIWTLLVIPCGLAETFSTVLASRFFA